MRTPKVEDLVTAATAVASPEAAVVLRRHPAECDSHSTGSGNSNDNNNKPDETQVSFTISSPMKRPPIEATPATDPANTVAITAGDQRLSASYTLPKRQSSSANASPVPFYKNHHMQQQQQQLSVNVKIPPQQKEGGETANVSATLNLAADNNSSPKSFAKKSLFDLDNANSLTLADKLRNEANKYTELSASNKSLNSIEQRPISGGGGGGVGGTCNDLSGHPPQPPERTKREIITGSTQSLNENVQLNNQQAAVATPPSKQLQYAERRPSWRLKFDAGSKVLQLTPNTICFYISLPS